MFKKLQGNAYIQTQFLGTRNIQFQTRTIKIAIQITNQSQRKSISGRSKHKFNNSNHLKNVQNLKRKLSTDSNRENHPNIILKKLETRGDKREKRRR